jgi:hypothetical protein
LERLRDELNRLRPNNASKYTGRPSSGTTTSTPPRPGTSLGFSSTSSARGVSTASGAAAASTTITTPTRPGSVVPRMYSSYNSPTASPSRSDSEPETPAIPPPAPIPTYISLAPSPSGTVTSLTPVAQEPRSPAPSRLTSFASRNVSLASQASRSKTPGPIVAKRSSASHSAVPVRPSTAMGSRAQHERWIPNQPHPSFAPPSSRSSRFSSRASGFTVVEEAE